MRVGTSEAGLSQRLRGTARSVSRLGYGSELCGIPVGYALLPGNHQGGQEA